VAAHFHARAPARGYHGKRRTTPIAAPQPNFNPETELRDVTCCGRFVRVPTRCTDVDVMSV
jgi:hypothetical protein